MKKRTGVALLAALTLLSLLSLFTAGVFAAASAARREGGAAISDAQVLSDAEYALSSVQSEWPTSDLPLLAAGQTETQTVDGSGGASVDTVSVTRLPVDLYWLVAASVAGTTERAHRRLNLILRLPLLHPLPGAALTSAGSVAIGQGVSFDQDTTRVNGALCDGGPTDILLAPGATVSVQSGGSLGSTASANQTQAGDTATYALAPDGWVALAARAGVQYSAGGRATLSSATIAYGAGDLTIDGGSGQGLLLVQGRLTVDGPLTFRGLIVAKGGVTVTGSADVTGAIMSAESVGTGVSLQNTSLHFSTCAVSAAARAAAVPRPVRGRAWLEMDMD